MNSNIVDIENKNLLPNQNQMDILYQRVSVNDSIHNSYIEDNQGQEHQQNGVLGQEFSNNIINEQNNDEISQKLLANNSDFNPNLMGQDIERPQMVDVNHQQYIPPPLVPPPAQEIDGPNEQQQGNQNSKEVQQILNNIRNIDEIEHCNHSDKKHHLYITIPKILASCFLLIFFMGGLVCMGVGLIFIIIIMAGENLCDDSCDSCKGCSSSYCKMCDQDAFFSCCYLLSVSCDEIPRYGTVPYDRNYYAARHNRKLDYEQYYINKDRDATCSQTLDDCFCCSCFDAFSFKGPTKLCILNRIEVYCTKCNTRIKVKNTGSKKIFPYLCIGSFGFAILTGAILIYNYKQN